MPKTGPESKAVGDSAMFSDLKCLIMISPLLVVGTQDGSKQAWPRVLPRHQRLLKIGIGTS
jgi:hypothetical protein